MIDYLFCMYKVLGIIFNIVKVENNEFLFLYDIFYKEKLKFWFVEEIKM